jgi:hypothetical protein
MARPKGKWIAGRRCAVCAHEQRGRIDYLIVSGGGEHGGGRRAIAAKFGLSESSIYNHGRKHISAEYRNAILAGPLASADDLRELAAKEGTSALQNFRSLYNGHRDRWLVALEAGDDLMMISHGRAMSEMLAKIARITNEIAPGASVAIQQNIFMSADYYNFERRAVRVLRRHPEALDDWLAEFREVERPALVGDAD